MSAERSTPRLPKTSGTPAARAARVSRPRPFTRPAVLGVAAAILSACTGALQPGPRATPMPPGSPVPTSPASGVAGDALVRWPWTVSLPTVDSVTTEVLAPAIRLHRLYRTSAPLRAFALDIDLEGCVLLRAVKGAPTAVGRRTTSALLQQLPSTLGPVAAVNADFFSFEPAGVPTGAHVEQGRVIAGPGTRPVFAMDSVGTPLIASLRVEGSITTLRDRLNISGWNRSVSSGISVLDQYWGQPADSSVTAARWTLAPLVTQAEPSARRYVVQSATRDQIARGDTLLVLAASGLGAGDTVRVQLQLSPKHPVEAVGGFPLLVRDGNIVADSSNSGPAAFRGLNPRSAVGIGAQGRRLLLLVADGRQPGVSVGLTINETAQLLHQLGATDALNLDGGGSSAMVLAAGVGRRDGHANARAQEMPANVPWLVNAPSDATGERAVANALAVLSACER